MHCGVVLLSALLLLVLILCCTALPGVSAFGNRTRTRETEESPSLSITNPTPTDDRSASFTQTFSESRSSSLTFSNNPGECSAEYSVFPLNFDTVPYSQILNAPESKLFSQFHFNSIQSTELAAKGFSVAVRLNNGVFFPNVNRDLAFRIYTKSNLIEDALVPAEQYMSTEAQGEYKSSEGHGLNDFWPTRTDAFEFRRTNFQVSLRVLPLPSFRIATDEWIIVQFFYNATAPLGCATKPSVLRVLAHRPSFYVPIIGGVALFVMVAGIVAAAAQQTIPSSHHASMVAIMANAHFAMEDGTPLPLALSPFQLNFGTTKYRYVYGAMYGNACIILISFLGQHLAMRYVQHKKGVDKEQAATTVLYPRLTSATVMMFAGSVLWGCGRNFGNQTSISYLVTSFVLIFTNWVLVKTHRVNISSTMQFQAEFVENEEPNAHPLLPNRQVISNVNDTFLASLRSKFTLQRCGFWQSTDVSASFVLRFGYVFENYKPGVKTWLLFECIDVAITSLLSVFDNYSVFLAFFQFSLTLIVKLIMLLALIMKKPLVSSQSSVAMLANYGGQSMGYLALAIGALRLELRPSADIVQGIAACIAMTGLLYDVLIHATTGIFHFYDLYMRQKDYDEHDETNEHRLELTGTFRRGKTAAEMAQIEREAQLEFWWTNYGLPKRREDKALAREMLQNKKTEEFLTSSRLPLPASASIGGKQQQPQQQQQQQQPQLNNNSFDENPETASRHSPFATPTALSLEHGGGGGGGGGNNNSNNTRLGTNLLDLSPQFRQQLETDRDWIFGKAAERQAALPHYQKIPRWGSLSFEEQTAFFRALFRDELSVAARRAVEEEKECERLARAQVNESDEEDEQIIKAREREVEGAPLLEIPPPLRLDVQQQSVAGTNRLPTTPSGNAFLGGVGGSDPIAAAASPYFSQSAAAVTSSSPSSYVAPEQSTHFTFSHHYDADGIFIDRYHPQYKAHKAARKAAKLEREQKLRESGLRPASSFSSVAAAEKREMTKEETFAAAARAAAADARASAMALVSSHGTKSYHNEAQLAREWEAIGRRSLGEARLPSAPLNEQDYLAL